MHTQKTTRQLVACFHVHQPRRLKIIHDPDHEMPGFDDKLDQAIMERVAANCYIPTNAMLLKMIEQYPQLKISFSISGLALEQMELYAPEALASFKKLVATGSVDIVAEPYYRSMAFLMESEEFEIQVLEHTEKIVEHFGIHPWVFKNTALFYNDDIGRRISMMGFQGIITEGSPSALRNNKAHTLYEHRDQNGLILLMRNPSLSDDIAYRVAYPEWELTAEKYMSWLESMPEDERLVVLSLDYETFGEHHKTDSPVINFLENLLLLLAMQNEYKMATPSEIVQTRQSVKLISIPDYIAVTGSSLSDWFGNDRQREAYAALIALEGPVKTKNNPVLTKEWRSLQTCDHFYYMSDVANNNPHLSPYSSAGEAYQQYMNMLQHLAHKLEGSSDPDAEAERRNDALETERRNLHDPVWAMSIDPRQHFPHRN